MLSSCWKHVCPVAENMFGIKEHFLNRLYWNEKVLIWRNTRLTVFNEVVKFAQFYLKIMFNWTTVYKNVWPALSVSSIFRSFSFCLNFSLEIWVSCIIEELFTFCCCCCYCSTFLRWILGHLGQSKLCTFIIFTVSTFRSGMISSLDW